MKFAPASPCTQELERHYPLTESGQARVALNRTANSSILSGEVPGFVGIIGACAFVAALKHITRREGETLTHATSIPDGLVYDQRLCIWKPRSDEASWWGSETTEPEESYKYLVENARKYGHGAAEIGHLEHARRYGKLLTVAWFGGRNGDIELKKQVALEYPDLPLLNKNPLSGEIDQTLEEVAMLNELRAPGAAPVILLYRGGENAKTPEEWEKQYFRAYEKTNGLMVVDFAHGAEMAHDPNGNFGKSVGGQLASIKHGLELARAGYAPVGGMSEMSNAESPVDPPIPLDLTKTKQLYEARMAQLAS